jgi:hypothetical protein
MKNREKKKEPVSSFSRPLWAYYITVGIIFIASYLTEYRIWGFNQWAFFPDSVKILFLAISILFPIVASKVTHNWSISFFQRLDRKLSRGTIYFVLSGIVTLTALVSFYFLKAKTHFLGDGYFNLGSLASANPLIKDSAVGAVKAHIWLKSLLGGNDEATSLLTFQIISILGGIIFLIFVFLLSRKLFESRLDSFLFALGISSGGYMLLFFGYVEYYALFVLSVTIYTIAGLLVLRGKLNKWLILPLVALCIYFHILGVTLLPSTIYLILSGTKTAEFVRNISAKKKLLFTVILGVILISAYFYFYTNSYRFRFAVVPIISDRFTVEGYTLFSINHLFDYVNLLFLLVPGLLVFVLSLKHVKVKELLRESSIQFLLILSISTLGAVFLLDPKLGMPRDWDLFSFAGICLTVLISFVNLSTLNKAINCSTLIMVVFLGILFVIPRAILQNSPKMAINAFKSNAAQDISKNRAGRKLLYDHYLIMGDTLSALTEAAKWFRDYPEHNVVSRSDSISKALGSERSLSYSKQMIQRNPMYASSYFAVGTEYLVSGRLDSALQYLEIANAINPHNPEILLALGTTHEAKGNIKAALRQYDEAIRQGLNKTDAQILLKSYPELAD